MRKIDHKNTEVNNEISSAFRTFRCYITGAFGFVVFVITQSGLRSPLNYTVSISPIIAALFRFWLGTKSRFRLRESTATLKREWWSPWLSYFNIRNTARQIPVERSRGKQESRECLHSALLRAAERSVENFKFLGRICGREYRKPGASTKLNTIAQSREISNLPLYASCGLRLRSWIACERSWNQFYSRVPSEFLEEATDIVSMCAIPILIGNRIRPRSLVPCGFK